MKPSRAPTGACAAPYARGSFAPLCGLSPAPLRPAPAYVARHPAASRTLAPRAFRAALLSLAVAAVLGVALRLLLWQPAAFAGLDYRKLLHAHSHLALLGWIGNALLALSAALFLPDSDARSLRRIYVVLQLGLVGMTATFPVFGYAAPSIAFSTLHLAGTAWLGAKLWHAPRAHPLARAFLRVAIAWLFASGLGPLALGPLAAAGLRGEPPYQLALYFYLHGQSNGWITFFLLAAGLQHLTPRADAAFSHSARCALRWLVLGSILTFAQSALWLDPPAWVRAIAALGGAAQLVGALLLARAYLRAAPASRPIGFRALAPRSLLVLAASAWFLKLALQTAAVLPALAPLTNHRFVIIAFLHLFFLGVVTPALFAAGFAQNWWHLPALAARGALVFLLGVTVSETLLVAIALGFAPAALPLWLLGSTLPLLAGATLCLAALRASPRPLAA